MYLKCFIVLFACFMCLDIGGAETKDPVVVTSVGTIRGVRATDGDYSMFMGIPYATVDSDNPFGKSKPFPIFGDIFEAYNDTALCPQFFQGKNMGTLDCLHLNIYVPLSASSENRLSVMVWIYGGGFNSGLSGRYLYGPKYLVKHDVILVTLNYRVDAYGFMCLDIPEVPGNQGLKDQYLAIQWIKDNIESFGGNVDKITLFGQSAGGHSIDLHLMSNKDKIFNNVILQSGSAVATTVLFNASKLAHLDIANYLGLKTNDTCQALSYLGKTDTKLIVEATRALGIYFKPCVEKQFEDVEAFISNQWINTRVAKVKGIPVLLGFTEHEMAYAYNNKTAEAFSNLDIVSRHINQTFDLDDEVFEDMKEVIENFYFGDETVNISLKLDFINFDSDYTYIHPVHRTLKNYLDSDAKNIYLYMFSYKGGINAIPNFATHRDDERYLFNMNYLAKTPTAEDELIIKRMTTMWTNFAKYGNPTPELSDLLPVTWQPVTKKTYNYLHIDNKLSLGARPLKQRMAFWDLFYDYNKKFQRGFRDI